MGGPPPEPNDNRHRSAVGRSSGSSYGPGEIPSVSQKASPRFGRAVLALTAACLFPSAVNSGIRPFGGSIMIEVRHFPSILNAPPPLSIHTVLYPPTLPAAPVDPSPPCGGALRFGSLALLVAAITAAACSATAFASA